MSNSRCHLRAQSFLRPILGADQSKNKPQIWPTCRLMHENCIWFDRAPSYAGGASVEEGLIATYMRSKNTGTFSAPLTPIVPPILLAGFVQNIAIHGIASEEAFPGNPGAAPDPLRVARSTGPSPGTKRSKVNIRIPGRTTTPHHRVAIVWLVELWLHLCVVGPERPIVEITFVVVCVHGQNKGPLFKLTLTCRRAGLLLNLAEGRHQDGHQESNNGNNDK